MVICGFDINNKKQLYVHLILLGKENEETFNNIFQYLSLKYFFKPGNFMYDFNLAQLKSIKLIFPDYLIHTCFFHFNLAI